MASRISFSSLQRLAGLRNNVIRKFRTDITVSCSKKPPASAASKSKTDPPGGGNAKDKDKKPANAKSADPKKVTVAVVEAPPTSATSCKPSVIAGITGGKTVETDICLYTGPPCQIEPCKPSEWSLEAIAPHEDAVSDPLPDAKVVVIGAGISGLAAASHLIKNNILNTTVLEASPRPGGRIKPVVLNGKVLELGAPCPASYHRTCDCPITDLAKLHGFMKPGEADKTNGLLVNCDGTERPLPVAMMAFKEFLDILDELKCVRYPPGEEEELIQSFLKIRLNHLMDSMPEETMEVAIRTIAGLLSMVLTPHLVVDSAAPFTMAGGIKVPMGHISIIAPYIEEIGADRILYNKRVTKIKWGTVTREQRPRAIVICSDGTSFKADYVIVALPLGVLKGEMNSLFCPALPAAKTNAIQKMTLIQKEVMYLSYASPLWVWRECPLNRLWTQEDLECREGWLKALRSVEEVPGTVDIIKVTLAGPDAIEFSKMTDMEIMRDFTGFLKEWQGDQRIPSPISMVRSSWGADKHYRGALPGAAHPDVEKELLRPVPFGCGEDSTIFFAGDGTAPNSCGTIGGALVSGFREAEQIVNLIVDAHSAVQHPCFLKCCVKNPNSPNACSDYQ